MPPCLRGQRAEREDKGSGFLIGFSCLLFWWSASEGALGLGKRVAVMTDSPFLFLWWSV